MKNLKKFSTLSTLGDPPINQLTSSYHIAEKLGLAEEILAYKSFEEAIEALKQSHADVALVAGAYPNIRDFIMDKDLICCDSFVAQIPPLVFCSAHADLPRQLKTLYLHPATLSLQDDVRNIVSYTASVQTQATSAAANLAKDDPDSGAICNQLAADYYGLKTYAILRAALHMPFVLFQRAEY